MIRDLQVPQCGVSLLRVAHPRGTPGRVGLGRTTQGVRVCVCARTCMALLPHTPLPAWLQPCLSPQQSCTAQSSEKATEGGANVPGFAEAGKVAHSVFSLCTLHCFGLFRT